MLLLNHPKALSSSEGSKVAEYHLVQVPAGGKEGGEKEGMPVLYNGITQKLHLLFLLITHWPELNHVVS